jgi:ribosomal-protein-alanine N-acetyltransferase
MPAIRPAGRDDLDQLMRLAAATPESPRWDRTIYENFLSPSDSPRRLFIAESGGSLTGFAAAQIIADICELESIAVAPAARRSGIGADLFATILEWARKHAVSRVQLEVRAGNAAAIAFYERAGFRRDGLRRGYYSDPPEDALLLSLPLAPPNTP